jgi:hypothetical protein
VFNANGGRTQPVACSGGEAGAEMSGDSLGKSPAQGEHVLRDISEVCCGTTVLYTVPHFPSTFGFGLGLWWLAHSYSCFNLIDAVQLVLPICILATEESRKVLILLNSCWEAGKAHCSGQCCQFTTDLRLTQSAMVACVCQSATTGASGSDLVKDKVPIPLSVLSRLSKFHDAFWD